MSAAERVAPVLELHGVTKRYGELRAVHNVSLEVEAGARHALIGPNGAGKSTLFHLVTGTVRPSGGRIVFHGRDVTRAREHRRTRLGMGRTFQQTSLFDGLTALENVTLAVQRREELARRVLPTMRRRQAEKKALNLLARVQLDDRAGVPARTLAHGERRQLEVALALATEPTLLLMDEPTAGLSREDAGAFLRLVSELPATLTVVLVEHDMDVVFGVATCVSVLEAGALVATGTPDEVRHSTEAQEAYLGRGETLEQLFRSPV